MDEVVAEVQRDLQALCVDTDRQCTVDNRYPGEASDGSRPLNRMVGAIGAMFLTRFVEMTAAFVTAVFSSGRRDG